MIRFLLAFMFAVSGGLAVAQTGSIEGKVKLLPRVVSEARAAQRYPGQPGPVIDIPKTPIPAIVFVADRFEGQTFVPPAKHPTLAQKGAWFVPEVMAVLVGTTVDFPNHDPQYHNVFSYSKAKRFDLGRYPTGESRAVTFDKLGVVKIYCEIHAHMQSFVVVCPNPYFAVTDTDGGFRIDNVPAGKHKLVAWRARGEAFEREADVTEGQTFTIKFE